MSYPCHFKLGNLAITYEMKKNIYENKIVADVILSNSGRDGSCSIVLL